MTGTKPSRKDTMTLADELLKLQQLRDSGALTPEEFKLAKDRLLQAPPPAGPPTSIHLLKEVDPELTRLANQAVKAHNAKGALSLIFGIIFAIIFLVVVCTMFNGMNGNNHPLGDLCNEPGITCR
jgi:hypothetical protein